MSDPDVLSKFPLFAELTQADLEELMAIVESANVYADRTLYREGQQADGMVLLVEGSLRLESKTTSQQVVVGAATALGALSLVGVGVREATAVTETACQVLWLRRSEFRRLTEDCPRTACRLLEAIAGDFAGRVRAELGNFEP